MEKPTRVKPKEPDVYDGPTDIRFWLMDIDDQLRERLISGALSQVTYAISYLSYVDIESPTPAAQEIPSYQTP